MPRRTLLIGLSVTALLVLLASLALLARPEPPRPVRVWVLAGQSNMAGNFTREEYDQLDAGLRVVPEVEYYNSSPEICDADRAAWSSLRPLCGTYKPWSFGPELSFGRELSRAEPGARLVIIKYARNDTSLKEDWLPGAETAKCPPVAEGERGCYGALLAVVGAALSDLRARYPGAPVELAGVVWMQGETDADPARDAASSYGANLRALIAALRRDLAPLFGPASPEPPPFLYGRLHRDNFFAAAPEVRAQQEALAADPSRPRGVVMVDTDPAELGRDRLHFSVSGQERLGELFATAAL